MEREGQVVHPRGLHVDEGARRELLGSAAPRLLAFTVAGTDPRELATVLDEHGVEARAGCHCASLAHRHLHPERPGTCRLSFAAYTSERDVDRATDALADVVRGR